VGELPLVLLLFADVSVDPESVFGASVFEGADESGLAFPFDE
jgi:hypothetical protein